MHLAEASPVKMSLSSCTSMQRTSALSPTPHTSWPIRHIYSASRQLPSMELLKQGTQSPWQNATYLMCFADFRRRMSDSSHLSVDAVTMHSEMPCCTAAAAACMVFVSSRASSLDLQCLGSRWRFSCCLSTCAKPAHQMRILRNHGRKQGHLARSIREATGPSQPCMHTC